MNHAQAIVKRVLKKRLAEHREILEAHRARGPLFSGAVDDLLARILSAD